MIFRQKNYRVPTVCHSLREAIESLEADHDFLTQGGVSKDLIEGYMELKWEEIYNFEHTPHQSNFLCIIAFSTFLFEKRAAFRRPFFV